MLVKKNILAITVALLGAWVSSLARADEAVKIDGSHLSVTREGEFDSSTEQLAGQFSKLKEGMTPTQVRAAFPKWVSWELLSNDRHIVFEYGFEWQTGVYVGFIFRNARPALEGDTSWPDQLSDRLKLSGMFVRKFKMGVKEGREFVEKEYSKPRLQVRFKPSMSGGGP